MNVRAQIFTVLGLCIAGFSVWVASGVIQPQTTQAAEAAQTIQLISARHDIRFGEEIRPEMLAVQTWPAGQAPNGAFSSVDALISDNPKTPRRAKESIRKGELLLASNISEFGETVTIVQVLGSNSRAMSIQVDAVTAVGGFVTPGDRVDIVLTEGRGDALRAATILQDIRVIGVDQNTGVGNQNSRVARTITVEVSPREGQILALGQRAGILSLTLRTERDVANETLSQISLEDLLHNAPSVIPSAAPVAAPAPEPARTIKVRRGVQAETVKVD